MSALSLVPGRGFVLDGDILTPQQAAVLTAPAGSLVRYRTPRGGFTGILILDQLLDTGWGPVVVSGHVGYGRRATRHRSVAIGDVIGLVPRASLTAAVNAVIAVADSPELDPRASGYAEPDVLYWSALARLGWTARAYNDELDRRVSAKWAFDLAVYDYDDEDAS